MHDAYELIVQPTAEAAQLTKGSSSEYESLWNLDTLFNQILID